MGLLTPTAEQALKDGDLTLAFLCELDFVPGVERYSSLDYSLDYDGETWAPTGGLAEVSPIVSSDDFRAEGLEIVLGGLPLEQWDAGVYTASNYKGRPARWIFVIVDPSQATPVIYAKPGYYYIDTLSYVVKAPELGIRLTLEHESTFSMRTRRKRYTNANQQALYPNDKGFQFLSYLASERQITWGSRGVFYPES